MASNFKVIRDRLGMTQAAIGAELGVTQGNVSFYENGQTVPPDIAARLIELCRRHKIKISFNEIYGPVKASA